MNIVNYISHSEINRTDKHESTNEAESKIVLMNLPVTITTTKRTESKNYKVLV